MVAPGEEEAPNYGARGFMHNVRPVAPIIDHEERAKYLLITALFLLADDLGMLLDQFV